MNVLLGDEPRLDDSSGGHFRTKCPGPTGFKANVGVAMLRVNRASEKAYLKGCASFRPDSPNHVFWCFPLSLPNIICCRACCVLCDARVNYQYAAHVADILVSQCLLCILHIDVYDTSSRANGSVQSRTKYRPQESKPAASMADLTEVLPNFDLEPWKHLTFSLEKRNVLTAELISLDPTEIVKRCPLPLKEVERMTAAVTCALKADLGFLSMQPPPERQVEVERPLKDTGQPGHPLPQKRAQFVKTLDSAIDHCLGGGFPTGKITEIVGER